MSHKIITLPLLCDNYAFIIISGDQTAIVDPAAASPVIDWLDVHHRTLTHILNTHHHGDHCDGNIALKEKYGAQVFGPDDPRVPGLDRGVHDHEEFTIGATSFRTISVPGHTRSHLAFFSPSLNAVFTGDALFACGCGRVFEEPPARMWESLLTLRALPDSTLIYPAHEYTEDNIRFALSVDPHNPALIARSRDVAAILQDGRPSIPATLAIEKTTNPFLRADDPAFARRLGMEGTRAEEVFGWLRGMKDGFR